MTIQVKKIKPEFVDKRGFISRIVDQKKISIKGVLIIASKAKSIRGEHYHKKDSHFIYCLSGKFQYSVKNMKKVESRIETTILEEGNLVLTPPMFWHSMEFLHDSVFLAITSETRNQDKYETDTVRIDTDNVKK